MCEHKRGWMCVVVACVISSGCATFSPSPDPARFFTLTSVYQVDRNLFQSPANPGRPSFGIRPIKFPGYLDREQIVTRISQNRFQVAENDRWAEPLEENFTRVLVQNLSALVPTARFVSYPWRLIERPDYDYEIEVLRFEANATASVELIARWLVREAGMEQALAVKEVRFTLPVKGSSTEAAVAALSNVLGEFSQEIAQTVQALEAKTKPRANHQ